MESCANIFLFHKTVVNICFIVISSNELDTIAMITDSFEIDSIAMYFRTRYQRQSQAKVDDDEREKSSKNKLKILNDAL